MGLLKILKSNKGTVSSSLGKNLAQQALAGNKAIINEAIKLVCYQPQIIETKNIRAGAAKIIEKVAEVKPELIASNLNKILPALEMPEPQTRWMAIRAIGYCTKENPKLAHQAIDYAKKFLTASEGVCLTGATAFYLGEIGTISEQYAREALSILENFIPQASQNEVDWILEAFIKIYDNVLQAEQQRIKQESKKHLNAKKISTQKRVKIILKK